MLNCTRSQPILTPIGNAPVMWSMLLLMPTISILGIIGNILSFIILKHCSEKVSSFFYIRCLTIFDSLALIFTMCGFYTVMVVHPLLLRYDFYARISDTWVRWGTCQLRTYLAFTTRGLSVWTIVIFTAERTIGIRFPMLSLKICTIRVAKIVVAILVVTCMLFNLTWIFSFDKRISPCNNAILCKANKFMLKFRILDFVMLSAFPAIIILFCNVLIIMSLRQRRRLSMLAFEEPKNKIRDRKIATQLLTVSFTFVMLTIPSLISTTINSVYERHGSHVYLTGPLANFYHIAMLLFTVNLSINFALYCFIGKNFRYAAYSLLCCKLKDMRMYRDALFETVSDTKSGTMHTNVHKSSTMEKENLLMKDLSTKPNPTS